MEAQDRLTTVKEEYDQLRHLMGELTSRREEIAPDVARAAQMRAILDSIEGDRRLLYWLRRAECERTIAAIAAELEAAASLREGAIFWSRFWKGAGGALELKLTHAAQAHRQQSWELEQCRSRFDSLIKSGYASAANLRGSKARLQEAKAEQAEAKERYAKLLEEQKNPLKRIKMRAKSFKRPNWPRRRSRKMERIQRKA